MSPHISHSSGSAPISSPTDTPANGHTPATLPADTMPSEKDDSPGHTVTIRYCTLCHWLLRAGWMAQELLSTFGTDLSGGVQLIPDTGGVFQIHCNGVLIWDRKRDGGFPDVKILKQRVRDLTDPDRDLGHVDRHSRTSPPTPPSEPGAPPS